MKYAVLIYNWHFFKYVVDILFITNVECVFNYFCEYEPQYVVDIYIKLYAIRKIFKILEKYITKVWFCYIYFFSSKKTLWHYIFTAQKEVWFFYRTLEFWGLVRINSKDIGVNNNTLLLTQCQISN